jgi:hypothetical protein
MAIKGPLPSILATAPVGGARLPRALVIRQPLPGMSSTDTAPICVQACMSSLNKNSAKHSRAWLLGCSFGKLGPSIEEDIAIVQDSLSFDTAFRPELGKVWSSQLAIEIAPPQYTRRTNNKSVRSQYCAPSEHPSPELFDRRCT